MANGAAALALIEPVTTPTKEKDLEQRIGTAVADAVMMVLAGASDWGADGRLSPTTRTRAGDLFVQLYKLQEAVGDELAFHAVARREGARTLRQRYGAALMEQCGVPVAALDFEEVLGWPLEIVRKITDDERAFRRAMSN